MSLHTFLHKTKPPPCFPFRRLLVAKRLVVGLQRDGRSNKAGDGTRTRDSLLGRQMVTGSPLACRKMALGERSYDSITIHAHLRQIVARMLRQMVMDLFSGKSIHFFLPKRQERQMVYLSSRFPVSLHITRNKSLGAGMHSPWHVFPLIAPLREAVFRALMCSHVVSENPLSSPQHRRRTCSVQRLICSNGSVACL